MVSAACFYPPPPSLNPIYASGAQIASSTQGAAYSAYDTTQDAWAAYATATEAAIRQYSDALRGAAMSYGASLGSAGGYLVDQIDWLVNCDCLPPDRGALFLAFLILLEATAIQAEDMVENAMEYADVVMPVWNAFVLFVRNNCWSYVSVSQICSFG